MIDFLRYRNGKKNKEIVGYPQTFSLKDYMSNTIDKKHAVKYKSGEEVPPEPGDAIYDLYAVVVHQGSSFHSGHYFSYCRSFEDPNTWYKCNDNKITKKGEAKNILKK